ncbi:hypothetical protein LCGC14_0790950 [marine sediment metagenome]|uniref:Uncharacterized protein n=1 Tax=marine sediment metagenome TaxID=412755 RepID=A0A0F9SZL6_9ZZZZ
MTGILSGSVFTFAGSGGPHFAVFACGIIARQGTERNTKVNKRKKRRVKRNRITRKRNNGHVAVSRNLGVTHPGLTGSKAFKPAQRGVQAFLDRNMLARFMRYIEHRDRI